MHCHDFDRQGIEYRTICDYICIRLSNVAEAEQIDFGDAAVTFNSYLRSLSWELDQHMQIFQNLDIEIKILVLKTRSWS